ncbi:hypothetical protein AOL_s00080g376 [Orbilia oligospora ATCC 24927]|uniref:Uncharacterized protein n=1 Tax=Arthrobotrys oligospora (strain ATCC 24927 / CBS 115.81 / DSM 1491) TaxID=756982 RepID=G1XEZ1_ARTOA|nr:hypothetical protein AOL_s00080g376 [Orbilia oligospora ATCC 24927]EGX48251.1 hypothetical protein AOL_s00080g376 [Orbilia oligospora ATCC 24927]
MTSRTLRAPVLPPSTTAATIEVGSLDVIPDIKDIERKQQAAEELLDQGKITEGSALTQEVARDLQGYQQWCLAEKVRRLKAGIAIQEEAIRLFRGRGTPQNTFVSFDELFSRAVDGDMKVDGEAHDLQLAGPQFERLAKKIRVTAQVLEAVYQDYIKDAAAAQKDQYARYYHAFCFPVCLNHRVFSPAEFRELGLRFQLGEAEEGEANEGGH